MKVNKDIFQTKAESQSLELFIKRNSRMFALGRMLTLGGKKVRTDGWCTMKEHSKE